MQDRFKDLILTMRTGRDFGTQGMWEVDQLITFINWKSKGPTNVKAADIQTKDPTHVKEQVRRFEQYGLEILSPQYPMLPPSELPSFSEFIQSLPHAKAVKSQKRTKRDS